MFFSKLPSVRHLTVYKEMFHPGSSKCCWCCRWVRHTHTHTRTHARTHTHTDVLLTHSHSTCCSECDGVPYHWKILSTCSNCAQGCTTLHLSGITTSTTAWSTFETLSLFNLFSLYFWNWHVNPLQHAVKYSASTCCIWGCSSERFLDTFAQMHAQRIPSEWM